jgi:GT2 family glycosyltransferase
LRSIRAALAEPSWYAVERVETILVDNGSSDGTVAAVRAEFPEVSVVELPENAGFAVGCNRGLAVARGRHVLLLNSDARVNRPLLDGCVAHLDAHPAVAVVGPQLLHPDGRTQNSIHNFPTLVTELIPKAALQACFRKRYPSKRHLGTQPVEVEAVNGAALFVRASAVRDVGPLPEEYFFYLEETAWCFEMRRAGWRVVHLPARFAVHEAGASSKRRDPSAARIEYHRSLFRYFRTHRGVGSMRLVMALRLLKNTFAVVVQAPRAVAGGPDRARWRARWDVLWWQLRGCPRAAGFAAKARGPLVSTQ